MYRIGAHYAARVAAMIVVARRALRGGGRNRLRNEEPQQVLGADIVSRVTLSPYIAPGGRGMAVSSCPRGYRAIGGGAQQIHDFKTADDWWTSPRHRPGSPASANSRSRGGARQRSRYYRRNNCCP